VWRKKTLGTDDDKKRGRQRGPESALDAERLPARVNNEGK
jgi:hypothetical protein